MKCLNLRKHLSLVGIHGGDLTYLLCGLQEDTANHILFERDALERNKRELRLALDSGQGDNTVIVSATL